MKRADFGQCTDGCAFVVRRGRRDATPVTHASNSRAETAVVSTKRGNISGSPVREAIPGSQVVAVFERDMGDAHSRHLDAPPLLEVADDAGADDAAETRRATVRMVALLVCGLQCRVARMRGSFGPGRAVRGADQRA